MQRSLGTPTVASADATTPAIVAHRGYAGRYPENTLSAVEAALRAGVRHVEVDVQLTADGVPVLFHDDALRRTTGRPGRITRTAWADLAGLSAGEPARLGDRFPDTPIPRLAGLVELLRGWPEALAFVEIKQESLDAMGTATVVERAMRDLQPLLAQCVVISFDAGAAAEARRLGARIGWVLSAWTPAQRARAEALAPEYLFCNHRKLPRGDAPLWPGPWQWACYEVTEAALALRLARRGVALIESMRLEVYAGPPWSLAIPDAR